MALYTSAVRGPYGSFFANLHRHTYAPNTKADASGPVETKTIQFCSLEQALQTPWAETRRRCHKMFYLLALAAAFQKSYSRLPTAKDEAILRDLATKVIALYCLEHRVII